MVVNCSTEEVMFPGRVACMVKGVWSTVPLNLSFVVNRIFVTGVYDMGVFTPTTLKDRRVLAETA